MTRHQNGRGPAVVHVDCIRMVTDVDNYLRSFGDSPPQLKWKEDVFVDVTQPFSDESANKTNATKNRLRPDDLRFDSVRAQALQHHGAEPLHALLLIGRIITEQQNH